MRAGRLRPAIEYSPLGKARTLCFSPSTLLDFLASPLTRPWKQIAVRAGTSGHVNHHQQQLPPSGARSAPAPIESYHRSSARRCRPVSGWKPTEPLSKSRQEKRRVHVRYYVANASPRMLLVSVGLNLGAPVSQVTE